MDRRGPHVLYYLLLNPTDSQIAQVKKLFFKLGLSFFLFGLINNGASVNSSAVPHVILNFSTVLYVIILSAALDLVPPSTPKGIIAFCNIFPALVAKVGWPYILKGRIRYMKRLIGCCLMSSFGMIVCHAQSTQWYAH